MCFLEVLDFQTINLGTTATENTSSDFSVNRDSKKYVLGVRWDSKKSNIKKERGTARHRKQKGERGTRVLLQKRDIRSTPECSPSPVIK